MNKRGLLPCFVALPCCPAARPSDDANIKVLDVVRLAPISLTVMKQAIQTPLSSRNACVLGIAPDAVVLAREIYAAINQLE